MLILKKGRVYHLPHKPFVDISNWYLSRRGILLRLCAKRVQNASVSSGICCVSLIALSNCWDMVLSTSCCPIQVTQQHPLFVLGVSYVFMLSHRDNVVEGDGVDPSCKKTYNCYIQCVLYFLGSTISFTNSIILY